MEIRRIGVVGLGPVGLTTAACFANAGFEVSGVDIDEKRVGEISNGEVPFYEPHLETALKRALKHGFRASLQIEPSDIYLVTVGTPSNPDGSSDLSFVKRASEIIGGSLGKQPGYQVVVVKSTVVPGTTEGLVKRTLESSSGKKIPLQLGLATNPEFLREGSAVEDTLHPDRVVIGAADEKSRRIVKRMYRRFYAKENVVYVCTSPVNAELIKYASNSFLAMKISFANTIADIASRLPAADITEVVKGIGLDKRIGPGFLQAGLGYGGSCFPKDVKALISTAKSLGVPTSLLEAVEEVNISQIDEAVRLARRHLGSLKGKRVTLLGLSFKPDTDDIREAASLRLIDRLLSEGAEIVVYDPLAAGNARKLLGIRISYSQSARQALDKSDCCFLVTEWNEFRKLNPGDFERMRTRVIIDGRRVLNSSTFGATDSYEAIGLGPR